MNNEEKILKILDAIQTDIGGLKEGQKSLEAGQTAMQADISGLKEGQKNLEVGQAAMQADIGLIKTQLHEHSAILGALQHSSEVRKADMDNLIYPVVSLSGEMKSFRTATNERFNIIEERLDAHDVQIRFLHETKADKRRVRKTK